jgi:hypothetical protein
MRDFISRRNILRAGATLSAAFSAAPFLLGGAAIAEDAPVRDYDAHVAKLREKFSEEMYAILVEKPFVVIGDMPAKSVQRWAEGTVRWSVKMLKAEYFPKDPKHILNIWLFNDKDSYESHNVSLFGSKPTTPYGYYSDVHKALVMNISTGGGTLVHEICHPFMAMNFPLCPSWFNEGLASLYEQCEEREGRIWGLTNWRLRGLQESIKDRRVPKFKTLCETTTREFYDDNKGVNYAQARYLCYYLQQQKKLREYYQAFRKNARDDPSGYATLQKVLEIENMDDFQKMWEGFVLHLRF